jgi:AraC family transcriptional regulator
MNAPTLVSPLGVHHRVPTAERFSDYFSTTRLQCPYDYGTVFYSPAERWTDHVDLHHNLIGIELTPGIVRTRLNSTSWSSEVGLRGALYFVGAGATIEVKKEQPIDFVLATVEPAWADRLFEEAGLLGKAPLLKFNVVDSAVESTARQIRQQFLQNGQDIPTLASALVLKAIDSLLKASDVRRKPQRYRLADRQIRAALDFIDENLGTPLSVKRLAEHATGLSGYFFAHAFSEMLGYSPHQYILDRRLSRGCELIRGTKLSLADIAYSVGFSSQAHMTSVLCKRFGVTPRALRQHHLD